MLNYSVVIRTLGKTGEKYQTLLNSVAKQNVKPVEVLVVIPDGYELPPEQLGYERFVRGEKGMLRQRIIGAKEAQGEYILFLDDDLEFEEDFVERLYEPIRNGIADASFPPLFSFLPPKKGFRKIIPQLSRSAVPLRDKTYYTKILKSGGWAYYHFEGEKNVPTYLFAQTAPGTCGFWKREDFLNIHLEEDLWVEDVPYPLGEDQISYYKLYLSGKRLVCVSDLRYVHLDGGGTSPDRKVKAAYANLRNKYIFWYKYIYCQQKNGWGKFCAKAACDYGMFIALWISRIQALLQKDNRAVHKMYKKGLKDGKAYVKALKEQKK